MKDNKMQTITLDDINPKNGVKYSKNLYRWMKKYFKGTGLPNVYVVNGDMWIGSFDGENWLIGSRVVSVLCNGPSAFRGAYCMKNAEKTLVENFWNEYALYGRCAIDKTHCMMFMDDSTRWEYIGKNTRKCKWCGNVTQILKRTVVKKTVKTWENEA